MASPGDKEPLFSRQAGRLPLVSVLWRPRNGTERSSARRPCPIPVADSATGEAPLPSPPGWYKAEHRDTSPAATHACFSRATGEDRQSSCPAQRQRPFPAALPGSSGSRHFSQRVLPMCPLMRPNTPAHGQKERLPKTGSLTGEDCGVACRRLKATWQGLLPFRGRTAGGAVTRLVAGSDVLRQREIFRDDRQPLKGGAGLPGCIRRRKVGMFPAGSGGGTSRPGRDVFRRRKVAVLGPGGPGGKGRRGRRSQKKRRMFVSGSKEVRQAVHAAAVCRGPRQQRGHAAAAMARTVRNLWCSMTDLHEGRRWYGMYICSALSP